MQQRKLWLAVSGLYFFTFQDFVQKHSEYVKSCIISFAGDSLNFDSVEEIPARFASDVDLYCRLSGQGPMRWERPDGRPLNRANQFPNGRLRIQNVQPQDAGVYLCIRGDQTQYVRLKVETGKKESFTMTKSKF